MDIRLPIALNTKDGTILHVSKRVPSGASLVCPFCRHPVKKNAGNVRRHHYVHMPGATCSATAETLLHEGSKIFLHNCLEEGRPVNILVDIFTLQASNTTNLLKSLGVTSLSITSKSICKIPKGTHHLEEPIGNIRPDVVTYGESNQGNRDVFAWEIFVTHEIEEVKAEILESQKIPYVELTPIEEGANEYIFRLVSYGGINFMDDDVALFESMYRDNKSDLMKEFKNLLGAELLNTEIEQARQAWKRDEKNSARNDVVRDIQVNVDEMTPADAISLAKSFSTIIYPIPVNLHYDDIANDSHWINIEKIDCEKFGDGYFVKINEKLLFLSALGMLRGIYRYLAMAGILKGLIAHDDKRNGEDVLVGVKLTLPLIGSQEIVERKSVLYRYQDSPTQEIDINETMTKKSKTTGKYYMHVNEEYFVDSYEWQLKNVIFNLLRCYRLEAHMAVDANNKQRIDAIKVKGLCDMHMIKRAILDIATRH
jgi:hypothetical protein